MHRFARLTTAPQIAFGRSRRAPSCWVEARAARASPRCRSQRSRPRSRTLRPRSSRGWTTSPRMRRRPTMSRVASGSISAAERLTYRIYFMPVEWAGLGPELLLALDRGREEPLRVQLERELRDAIRSGRLAAGERLPSSRALAAELGYGDPRGLEALRGVLAGYLRRVRGAVADAEQVVLCSGFAQGINLVLRSLAQAGIRRVAIEDPGDNDYLAICARLGMEAVPVAIDERGIEVRSLAASGVRAVILTPTHQFPTGPALAPERRQALVDWAIEHDATIVEDDYDAEFRYDRDPVRALQGLAPDRVALIGTVGKSLAPSLRLGRVVYPGGVR